MTLLNQILDLACPHSGLPRQRLERLASIILRGANCAATVPGSLAQVGHDQGAVILMHGACCFKRLHVFTRKAVDEDLIAQVEALRPQGDARHDDDTLRETDRAIITAWIDEDMILYLPDHKTPAIKRERFACVHILPSVEGLALYSALRYFWPLLTVEGMLVLHRQESEKAKDPCWEALHEEDVAELASELKGLITVRKQAGSRLKSARHQDASK